MKTMITNEGIIKRKVLRTLIFLGDFGRWGDGSWSSAGGWGDGAWGNRWGGGWGDRGWHNRLFGVLGPRSLISPSHWWWRYSQPGYVPGWGIERCILFGYENC